MPLSLNLKIGAAAFVFYLALPSRAEGQTHEKSSDRFILRSSVVSSLSIPDASAKAAGIQRAANVGILNVTVLRKGSQLTETVPADVKAEAVDLAGARRLIRLNESRANGWVSYTGTFTFAPREVLDFHVSAQPAGGGQPLEMTYREQVWVDRKAP